MQSMRSGVACLSLVLISLALLVSVGCTTAPKQKNQASVIAESRAATTWFRNNVTGLSTQLNDSAGYISFPGVGQFGVFIGGGKFGRGVVSDESGRQVGWAYLNTASAGLQLGAQGFKMLVVFEDPATMQRFQQNKLSGNVSGTVVAGEAGAAGHASFTDGVAVYIGDATGLMAGASIGLDYIRYESAGGG